MQSTDPSAGAQAPQPGWYPDPWQVAPTRWWDGMTWTGFTTPNPAPATALYDVSYGATYGTTYRAPAAELPVARTDIEVGGIAILGYFGALALSLICAQVASFLGMRPLTVPNFLAGIAGLWTGLCMAAFIVSHRRPGGTIADLGFYKPTGNEIGIGIGIGIVGIVVAGPVANALRSMFPDTGGSHLFVSGSPSFALAVVFGLTACIGAPIVEELFFRGVVQTSLMRDLGTAPGVVIQAMLFGLAHFQLGMTFNQGAVRCGTVMVLGVFLGWLRARSGRLGSGIVAHATYNTIITIITLIVVLAASSSVSN